MACTGTPKVTGLVGLDDALNNAITDIESKLPSGTPIVVTAITAPQHETREYIGEELSSRFKNLKTLARDSALSTVMKEQEFQMSGIVSDESAVGIGHFIGAQAVISGDIRNYTDFTQLRLRIVNVRTAEFFTYSARINNKDRLLANIQPNNASSSDRPVRVSNTALDHLNRGNDLLAQKKYNEALQEFDQAIAIDSKFVAAYRGRGIAYYQKIDDERAIAELDQAIRLNPKDTEAYHTRGLVYFFRGYINESIDDLDRAIADFTSVIRINSKYAEAYLFRGQSYSQKNYFRQINEFDREIEDYTNAIRVNPNYAGAYIQRGISYSRKGDFDRAIADITSGLRIEPNNDNAYFERGMAFSKKSDFVHAIADFTSAIRLTPNQTIYYSYRGKAYTEKGDFDRAIADFNNVIRIKPDSADGYYSRGRAHEAKGDLNNAIADYETAMQLGYNWLNTTIDRLRQQQRR